MRHLTEASAFSFLMAGSPPLDGFAQMVPNTPPNRSTRITTMEVQACELSRPRGFAGRRERTGFERQTWGKAIVLPAFRGRVGMTHIEREGASNKRSALVLGGPSAREPSISRTMVRPTRSWSRSRSTSRRWSPRTPLAAASTRRRASGPAGDRRGRLGARKPPRRRRRLGAQPHSPLPAPFTRHGERGSSSSLTPVLQIVASSR